ncbi:MAG: protein translocase subunit SecF [Deltaproteobacteria bacterium]|jgi:preprotein translocase subunit SecF|nr:protein translocase subunit SecF [Deltaproteobacteria bacterium]
MSLEIIKPDVNINFIGNRRYAFLVSGALILISLLSIIFHKGLNLGVDFSGGFLVQARFSDASVSQDKLNDIFTQGGFLVSSIQDFGKSESGIEYLINLRLTEEDTTQTITAGVISLLDQNFGAGNVEIRRQELVGPKVGEDLKQKALYAVYYAILIIIIYISGRFEQKWGAPFIFAAVLLGIVNLVSLFHVGVGYLIITALIVTIAACYYLRFSYALGGILALIHDIIITTGIFSLLNKEITLSFVAAILTIIGYSLNDSIIVFDRIRENYSRNRKGDYALIINRSINETLSRTILTSGTTILALLSLFFLGGPVNRDFALALTIGIIVGTFSSIFIAAPLLLLWERKEPKETPPIVEIKLKKA